MIEGVHVSGSLKTPDSRQLLGGLVGRMDYAKVSKCSTNLEITGSFNTTGGLIGQMSNLQHGSKYCGKHLCSWKYQWK